MIDGRTLNGKWHVFLHDRNNNTTVLVSQTAGAEGDGDSTYPEIVGDAVNGYFIVYASTATNLDAAITTTGLSQIYYYDVANATNTCVSVSNSAVAGNGNSLFSSATADGRYITFQSEASNLVSGDTNNRDDTFIRNMVAGTTSLISRNSEGDLGNNDSKYPSIGTDANYLYVSFASNSTNLISDDTNGYMDVFVEKQKDENK